MSLDDFLKGISVFNKGLTDLATAQAVSDAKEDLEDLKLTFAEREGMTPEQVGVESKNYEEARNAVSQNLALRLGQAGASASQIQLLSQQLGMTEPEQRRLDLQRQQLDQRKDIAEIQADARFKVAQANKSSKQGEVLRKVEDTFMKRNKEIISGLEKVAPLKANFLKSPNRKSAIELLKTGIMKAAGETRISDADVDRIGFPNSYAGRTWREVMLTFTDGISEEEQQYFEKVVNTMQETGVNMLRDKAKAFVESQKAIDPGINSQRLKSALERSLGVYRTPTEELIIKQFPEAEKDPAYLQQLVEAYEAQ